jgi:hypothetical protein
MSEITHETLMEDFRSSLALSFGLAAGMIPTDGKVISRPYSGDTKAEALGKAYANRDKIRENGGECEAHYVEEAGILDGVTYHTIEIVMSDGDSNSDGEDE